MANLIMGVVVVVLLLALFVVAWILFGEREPQMPSPVELDAMACSQMREQGWAEEEIKQYMDESGGYYDKD